VRAGTKSTRRRGGTGWLAVRTVPMMTLICLKESRAASNDEDIHFAADATRAKERINTTGEWKATTTT